MADEVALKDTLNQTRKESSKSGFGFKLMQKMGWKEDKGLGKNETGTTNYIKVAKRDVGQGLGSIDKDSAGNRAWSETAMSFNAVLESLKNQNFEGKVSTKKTKLSKKDKAKKSSISVGIK